MDRGCDRQGAGVIRIPHLETDVTMACQLSCASCNHFVPLWRPHHPLRTSVWAVERDLTKLATLIHADAWGALGGEPTLHPDLCDILAAARRSGVADQIEVWTNGLQLARMPPRFWTLFDRLVLSVYAGKLSESDLVEIDLRCQDAGVELRVYDERVRHNFRALLENEPTDIQRTRQKWNACFFRGYSRVADEGFFFTCCCSPHAPVLLHGLPFGTDGIEIATLTADTLNQYLERTTPLVSCSTCALAEPSRHPVAWREERDAQRWLDASKAVEVRA